MRSLLLILALGLIAAPAADGEVSIQPGAEVSIRPAGGTCTLSFVFDGLGPDLGRVFIATAAHCSVHRGDAALADQAYIGEEPVGRLAMVGDPADHALDYALIEVFPNLHASVVPEVRGHPGMPTGFTTPGEVAVDDRVLFSGNGLAFSYTQQTREEREGTLRKADASYYQVTGPLMQGDSGGPVLHAPTGKALGTVAGDCSDSGCLGDGPTVQGILALAGARALALQLRVAGGKAPAPAPPPAEPAPASAAPAPAPAPAPATPFTIRAQLTCVRHGRARLTVVGSAPVERVTVRGRSYPRTAIRLSRLPRRGTLSVRATGGGRRAGTRVRLRACRG